MKGKLFLGAAVVSAITFSSCNTTPSTKVELKTEADSLSYAFGASVVEGVDQGLMQSGILKDTMSVSMEYKTKIAEAADDATKAKLEKEQKTKIDSIQKANDLAIQNFIKGFAEGINSRESEAAYNLGVSYGSQVAQHGTNQLKAQFFAEDSKEEINKKALIAAATATVLKEATIMENPSAYMMAKSGEVQQRMIEKARKEGEVNKQKGEEFLAENAKKDGVITLASGVQYKVIKEGTGKKPSATDRIRVDYHGSLINGVVFDSSIDRGEPAEFGVDQVIPGWTEVLQLMPEGSEWEVYIPYNMAYGENGAGADITPYSTLIFKVNLLEVLGK